MCLRALKRLSGSLKSLQSGYLLPAIPCLPVACFSFFRPLYQLLTPYATSLCSVLSSCCPPIHVYPFHAPLSSSSTSASILCGVCFLFYFPPVAYLSMFTPFNASLSLSSTYPSIPMRSLCVSVYPPPVVYLSMFTPFMVPHRPPHPIHQSLVDLFVFISIFLSNICRVPRLSVLLFHCLSTIPSSHLMFQQPLVRPSPHHPFFPPSSCWPRNNTQLQNRL